MKLVWFCIKVKKSNRKLDVPIELEPWSDFRSGDPLEMMFITDHSKRKEIKFRFSKKYISTIRKLMHKLLYKSA